MLFVGGLYVGPKTRWQYELEKCSKNGLLLLLNSLFSIRSLVADETDHQAF
jgi:hypothetical protein